MNEELVN